MYSWDNIEETTLAKLDLDQDGGLEANKIGYINRFIVYANEAMVQIASAIKPKRTSVTFTVYDINNKLRPINAKYTTYTDISISKLIQEQKSIYNYKMTKDNCISNISVVDNTCCVELVNGETYTLQINSTENNADGCECIIVDSNDDTVMYNVILPSGSTLTFMVELQYYNIKEHADNDFIAFSDSPSYEYCEGNMTEIHDDKILYHGFNTFMMLKPGKYSVAYKALWKHFTIDITNDENRRNAIDVPDDVLVAVPSYIASQCYKVDDEYKAQLYRNEYEMFLARIDDTDFDNTTTIKIGGDW